MSTRALYSFRGPTAAESWNVYKHHDGYPTGAAQVLQDTLMYFAWPLPRYEADEFAGAFCAAGKSHYYLRAIEAKTPRGRNDALSFTALGKHGIRGGSVRFMPQGNPLDVASSNCSDIEYRYEVFQDNNHDLRIRAYKVDAFSDDPKEELLVDCSVLDFIAEKAKECEKMQMAS